MNYKNKLSLMELEKQYRITYLEIMAYALEHHKDKVAELGEIYLEGKKAIKEMLENEK